MENPNPINLTTDDYWRSLGWPALARDADGHLMSTCSIDHDATFNDWLRECFDAGWTVTDLRLAQSEAKP